MNKYGNAYFARGNVVMRYDECGGSNQVWDSTWGDGVAFRDNDAHVLAEYRNNHVAGGGKVSRQQVLDWYATFGIYGMDDETENDVDQVNIEPTTAMNPKYVRALKDGKPPLEALVGGKVDEEEAWVLAHGGQKYGVRNWRKDPILAKTYVGAIRRHLNAWADGQDLDPDSGKRHLAHIRACCAVAMDAEDRGTMIDNRLEMESKSQ